MFKKLSYLVVVALSFVLMNISAFAINPPSVPSEFNMKYDIQHIDEFLDTGCGEFARAFKNGDFSNMLVTAHYYYNNYSMRGYWDNINIYYFPSGFEFSNLKYETEYDIRYSVFDLNFVNDCFGCSFLCSFNEYPSIYKGSLSYIDNMSYILCNFSDERIVNKIRSLVPLNSASYNIFDINCQTLKFKDTFIDGVIVKLPPPPPLADGVIGSYCFEGFIDNFVDDLTVILPIVIFIFSFLLCIYTTIKSLRYYVRG